MTVSIPYFRWLRAEPFRALWWRVLTLTLVLVQTAVFPARADITKNQDANRIPVPVARPAQANAVRGFPVEIPLSGLTSSPRMLQFILRSAPKHGRIEGAPVQAGKDSAVVRYIPNSNSEAPVDTFTFAVKLEGSASSAEATVTIRLADPAPVLVAQGGLDLGRVIASETVEHPIRISNKGNSPWQATVPLPAGWSWKQPAGGAFDLGPGQTIEAILRVRPAETGELDHKILLHGNAVVRVIGRVLPPFLGYPSLVRLQWERGSAERAWQFRIRNNSPEPVTVQLEAPADIQLPASVTVPVAESVDVRVTCAGDLSRVLEGQIRMAVPGWSQEIRYDAPAAPAAVLVTGADETNQIDFGIPSAEKPVPAPRTLTLRNAGGMPAVIRWDPLRFFEITGLEPESKLAPQATAQLVIRPKPDEPGRLKETLNLRMTGGDQTIELLADINPELAQATMMSGKVLNSGPLPAPGDPAAAPRRVTEEGKRLRVQILGPGGGLMERIPNQDPSLPAVSVIRLDEEATQPDKLVFGWDAPAEGTWTYRVLVRMLRNHGPMQVPIPEYDQMDNVKVTSTATGGRAEVTKLRPDSFWKCRIVAIRSDGVSTVPSEELTFITPSEKDSRWGWRILAGVGVLALALYVRQKWREDVKWKD